MKNMSTPETEQKPIDMKKVNEEKNRLRGTINLSLSELRKALSDQSAYILKIPAGAVAADRESLENFYLDLTALTRTLETDESISKKHRLKLIEQAENTKTLLLNLLLLQSMIDLGTLTENSLKMPAQQSSIKDFFTYIGAFSTLVYGAAKGYSALAGFLLAVYGHTTPAIIAASSASAAIFCVMYYAFETRELCNARGLTGNNRNTRMQIALQYHSFECMGEQIKIAQTRLHQELPGNDEQTSPSKESAQKHQRIKDYRKTFNTIHQADMAQKASMAKTYKDTCDLSGKSTAHKVAAKCLSGFLALLNGTFVGFLGLTAVSLIVPKYAIATAFTLATASTPAGAIALAVFGIMLIAGVGISLYVKKHGLNLVQAYSQKKQLLDVGKKESQEASTLKHRVDSLALGERGLSNFFAPPAPKKTHSPSVPDQCAPGTSATVK